MLCFSLRSRKTGRSGGLTGASPDGEDPDKLPLTERPGGDAEQPPLRVPSFRVAMLGASGVGKTGKETIYYVNFDPEKKNDVFTALALLRLASHKYLGKIK